MGISAIRKTLLLGLLAATTAGCGPVAESRTAMRSKRIPKVLILTTGREGKGALPPGVIVSLEAFNKLGAFVRIENKDILYDSKALTQYSIILAPTIYGYHDGDRRFSLTYMDDAMLQNLSEWVEAGGFLIAGENIGRNTLNDIDRVVSQDKLDGKEWALAHVFGYEMIEKNLEGFSLLRNVDESRLFGDFTEEMVPGFQNPEWILVPDTSSVSEKVTVFSEWRNENTRFPGITLHPYGEGFGLYIPFFRLLHPSIEGGAGDIPEIQGFYRDIYEMMTDSPARTPFHINTWPFAKISALAVTLDDGGTTEEYKRTLVKLFELPLVKKIDFFVTNNLRPGMLSYLKSDARIVLGNHSFSHPFFSSLDYCQTVEEIAKMETQTGKVKGFRFPFVDYATPGMFVLDQRGYTYDSSVRVNHHDAFRGSVFPYNIPIYKSGEYYLTTELMELSPVQEDWYFYGEGVNSPPYSDENQKKDAAAYYTYLKNTWEGLIKPGRGMMIQMGHPLYQGHSEITMEPLVKFLREVDKQTTWAAGLNDIANWWAGLMSVEGWFRWEGKTLRLHFSNPRKKPLNGLTIRMPVEKRVLKVKSKNTKARIEERKEEEGRFIYIIFDLEETAELQIRM